MANLTPEEDQIFEKFKLMGLDDLLAYHKIARYGSCIISGLGVSALLWAMFNTSILSMIVCACIVYPLSQISEVLSGMIYVIHKLILEYNKT